ncbi:MAG: fluoride efflux transporter CrcB [Thermodesulfobacteria bacterium]|nr:fluoride efflux transporter CrcB [Thermodesulfobacteriota bacterium]
MPKLMWVGLGGFFGALTRYLISGLVARWCVSFPCGTLFVNVTGSFFLGFLMTLAAETLVISPNLRLLLAIGFLGSYTTFSTFAYETNSLLESNKILEATLNVGLSVFLGLAGIRLGVWLARNLL